MTSTSHQSSSLLNEPSLSMSIWKFHQVNLQFVPQKLLDVLTLSEIIFSHSQKILLNIIEKPIRSAL